MSAPQEGQRRRSVRITDSEMAVTGTPHRADRDPVEMVREAEREHEAQVARQWVERERLTDTRELLWDSFTAASVVRFRADVGSPEHRFAWDRREEAFGKCEALDAEVRRVELEISGDLNPLRFGTPEREWGWGR